MFRLRRLLEANTMQVINFDKGSKRRLREMRWKLSEIIIGVMMLLMMIATTVLAVIWAEHLDPNEPDRPSLEIKR
jgi:hypothetical protein